MEIIDLKSSWHDWALSADSALTARYAYLALSGELFVDKNSMAGKIAATKSPVADQILTTIKELEGNDWQFIKTPPGYSPSYISSLRQIRYPATGWQGETRFILGHGSSPINNSAVWFSHEVGHHDVNNFRYEVPPKSEASMVMKKRGVIGETRAILTESHMSDLLKPSDPGLVGRQVGIKAALKNGTLGEYITTVTHPSLGGVPVVEMNKLVGEYVPRTYGQNTIDPLTGSVRPFNIKAGFGTNFVEPLVGDIDEIISETHPNFSHRANRVFQNNEVRLFKVEGQPLLTKVLERTKFLRAGESAWAGVAGHGSRAVVACGLALAASDLIGQYELSVSHGNGRLARVLADWSGFEGGAAAARSVVRAAALRNPWTATAVTLGAGLVATEVIDFAVGKALERSIIAAQPL